MDSLFRHLLAIVLLQLEVLALGGQHPLLPEVGVLVELHLRVEADHLPVRRQAERIDLHLSGVQVHEQLEQVADLLAGRRDQPVVRQAYAAL